eukprot:3696922-Rhodomonas_salina.2
MPSHRTPAQPLSLPHLRCPSPNKGRGHADSKTGRYPAGLARPPWQLLPSIGSFEERQVLMGQETRREWPMSSQRLSSPWNMSRQNTGKSQRGQTPLALQSRES